MDKRQAESIARVFFRTAIEVINELAAFGTDHHYKTRIATDVVTSLGRIKTGEWPCLILMLLS